MEERVKELFGDLVIEMENAIRYWHPAWKARLASLLIEWATPYLTTGAVDDTEVEPYFDPELPEEVVEHLEWQRTHRH